MSRTTTVKDKNALRITTQYRDREKGMVYELRCGDDRIAVRREEGASVPGGSEWRFEARTPQSPEVVVLGAWVSTRTAALEDVARLWSLKVPSLGIPSFDWVAVATALAAVKAL